MVDGIGNVSTTKYVIMSNGNVSTTKYIIMSNGTGIVATLESFHNSFGVMEQSEKMCHSIYDKHYKLSEALHSGKNLVFSAYLNSIKKYGHEVQELYQKSIASVEKGCQEDTKDKDAYTTCLANKYGGSYILDEVTKLNSLSINLIKTLKSKFFAENDRQEHISFIPSSVKVKKYNDVSIARDILVNFDTNCKNLADSNLEGNFKKILCVSNIISSFCGEAKVIVNKLYEVKIEAEYNKKLAEKGSAEWNTEMCVLYEKAFSGGHGSDEKSLEDAKNNYCSDWMKSCSDDSENSEEFKVFCDSEESL
ncbi:MAG: hypothetical protein ACI8ZF_000968 [Candidatus Midichloriaceae bacterium]|jgi:hypothetical protein